MRGRHNTFCYECGAKERHRLLSLYLRRNGILSGAAKREILYFAPVQGIERQLRDQKHIEYTTTDLFIDHVDVRADITSLSFPDNKFDTFICSHVLEHIPNQAAALDQLRRITSPEGKLLLMVPINYQCETIEDPSIESDREREQRFGAPNHVRLYGRDFPVILQDAGFDVREFTVASEFSAWEANFYGLIPEETIYVCRP